MMYLHVGKQGEVNMYNENPTSSRARIAAADAVAASAGYYDRYDAAYAVFYKAAKEAALKAYAETGFTYEAAFELLDEMLPVRPLMKPVAERNSVAKQLAKLTA